MALTLFVAATIVIEALAIVFLVRGLRAASRAACMRGVGHCAALAFGVVVLAGVAKAMALWTSMTGVAGADPSEKALLLSRSIEAAMTARSLAVPATLLPLVFAALLFLRGRRYPPAPLDPAAAGRRQQVRR